MFFLVLAFRSAEAEVLLPFQLQYAAPADVVHIAAQRLHQPAEFFLGGILLQQVVVLVASVEEEEGVRPSAQPVQLLLLGLAAVPHEAEIAQHNDEIALAGPAQLPVFEAVQLAVVSPVRYTILCLLLRSVKSPQKPCHAPPNLLL